MKTLVLSLLLALAGAPAAFGADTPASPNPLQALDKNELKAFVEMPLFDPARRLPPAFVPVPEPVVAQPPAPIEPPPNVHLLGIVHGIKDVAVLRGPDMKTSMISSGDRYGEWDLSVVSATSIRLTMGQRTFDYSIFAPGVQGYRPPASPAPQ